MYRAAIVALFAVVAGFATPVQSQPLPNVKLGPLPVPSYWVSDHGSQLKLYSYDAKPIAGIPDHGYFNGVISNTAAAPPGCQYGTFEVKGEYVEPQYFMGVKWKNLTQDCGTQTAWVGILNGQTLQLEWMLSKTKANGGVGRTLKNGFETFKQQP
jgi:hypothetical protein